VFSKIDPAPSGSKNQVPICRICRCTGAAGIDGRPSSHEAATRFQRGGKSWELCGGRSRAPGARLRGDVCTNFAAVLVRPWRPIGLCRHGRCRTVVGSGPAVTIRASPVFVRADSSSHHGPAPEARICSNGIRASFELPVFKGLPLTYCVSLHPSIFPPWVPCNFRWHLFPVVGTSRDGVRICGNIC
jgi:hypothetical protein